MKLKTRKQQKKINATKIWSYEENPISSKTKKDKKREDTNQQY